ncbi:Cell wall protein AWA1 [Nakaseomyces glabratus]|nr:Cell wall protein AWA1 [Nakaseomyces glabratus]
MNPSFIIFFFLQILVRSVRADVTISADQTASTDVLYSEPVSILKDVKYTVNADTLQFTNGLNNAGTLVFADTVGSDVEQKLVVSNGDFINSGEVDVTCNSITTPSYMFNVANFKNEGTMYFKGTQNAVQYGASQVTLISTTESIVNDGSMTFDGIENAYLKSSGTITNNGKISVQYNSGFAVSQSILGSGSIELGLATTLWFDDPSNTDISGQKVIQTEGSVIVFDTTKLTKPFTVNFGKFGGQNLFAVTTPVTSTSYDSITGILTIKVNGQDISLVLGTNLDPFGFIASPVSNPVTSPLDGQQHQIYTIVYSGVSVPPLPSPETKTITEKGVEHEVVVSYISTTSDNQLVTITTTSTIIPPFPKGTTSLLVENDVTIYDVYSYFIATNDQGAEYTATTILSYSPPAPTTVTIYQNHEHIQEVYSYYITVDGEGKIITESKLVSSTISYDPAPGPETKIVDLGNEVTEYDVISYYTTVDENGKVITTSTVDKFSPPPVSTITIYENHEHIVDVYSYFITVDGDGKIITDSKIISSSISYDPAPGPETKIVDLGNEVTEYDVISYYTTVDENGKVITTSTVDKFSPPPVSTITIYENHEHIVDVYSYFITVDGDGKIITDSKIISSSISYDPAPGPETKIVDLGNEVTEYDVISYYTTVDENGKVITTSTTTKYSPPPLTVTATTASDYVESDWISFFITVDEKGDIVTSSTLFNATRDYKLPEAPHTSFGPAPPVETHTVVLENNMTNYEVVSYWTTTNEFGGLITTSSTSTYSAPPLTVTATTASDYVESDWISFFITVDEKGDIVTSSTLFNATRDYKLPEAPHTSFGPAPPVETHTVVLENNMTNYEVVSYWTTTNEFGGLITTSSTSTYSAPPLTVTATTASDYVESDWISFFITVDEKGDIVTSSTLFNATRDYKLPEAPHTSFGPAPPVETHTVVLENNMTNYEVVSYWTTTNEFGGLITTSSTSTYSAPPLTVTATTASDYVESDWISFFITVDEKGDIVTSSTLFNATRDYKLPEAPHTSFGPAPPVETHTVVLENNMTNYEVVSYWTTTNEFGGLITTSSTSTYSAPPLTVTATTASDYVESDWISFFITVDEKGDIVTSSTLFNATRDYKLPEAPHTSFGPAPPVETHTVVLENNMTNYEVVSYWTTTNEFGGLITTSSTSTYSAPPLTVTATTASDYVESDWISFFITVDEKGDIVTSSTLFNATRDYKLPDAPYTFLGDHTTVITSGGKPTTVVVSHITTTDSNGHSTVIETTLPVGSGSNDHTTVITSGGKPTTVVVSHITTTDSNGHSTVIETTLPVGSGSNDHTTVITSGGKPTTVVVSHITTTDSNGNTVTIQQYPTLGEPSTSNRPTNVAQPQPAAGNSARHSSSSNDLNSSSSSRSTTTLEGNSIIPSASQSIFSGAPGHTNSISDTYKGSASQISMKWGSLSMVLIMLILNI